MTTTGQQYYPFFSLPLRGTTLSRLDFFEYRITYTANWSLDVILDLRRAELCVWMCVTALQVVVMSLAIRHYWTTTGCERSNSRLTLWNTIFITPVAQMSCSRGIEYPLTGLRGNTDSRRLMYVPLADPSMSGTRLKLHRTTCNRPSQAQHSIRER